MTCLLAPFAIKLGDEMGVGINTLIEWHVDNVVFHWWGTCGTRSLSDKYEAGFL
jgi:hypothetical protein